MKHCAKKLLGLAFALALCLAVGGTAFAVEAPEFADVPAALPEQEMLAFEPNVAAEPGTNSTGNLERDGYTVIIPTTVEVKSGENNGKPEVKGELEVTAVMKQWRTLLVEIAPQTPPTSGAWTLKYNGNASAGTTLPQVEYNLPSGYDGEYDDDGKSFKWLYDGSYKHLTFNSPKLGGVDDVSKTKTITAKLAVTVPHPEQATMSGTYSDTLTFKITPDKTCVTYNINVYEQKLQLTNSGTHVEAVDVVDANGNVIGDPTPKLTKIFEYPLEDKDYPWTYSSNDPEDDKLRWEELPTVTMNAFRDKEAGNKTKTFNLQLKRKWCWLDVNGIIDYNGTFEHQTNGNQEGEKIGCYLDVRISPDDKDWSQWYWYPGGDDYWERLPYGTYVQIGFHHLKDGYIYDTDANGNIKVIANGVPGYTEGELPSGTAGKIYRPFKGQLIGEPLETDLFGSNSKRYCFNVCYHKAITYYANNGTDAKKSIQYEADKPLPRREEVDNSWIGVDGATFAGWSTEPTISSDSEILHPNDIPVSTITWPAGKTRTLYAIWQHSYKVKLSFESQGGWTNRNPDGTFGEEESYSSSTDLWAGTVSACPGQKLTFSADATDESCKTMWNNIQDKIELRTKAVAGAVRDSSKTSSDIWQLSNAYTVTMPTGNTREVVINIKRQRYLVNIIAVQVDDTGNIVEEVNKDNATKYGEFNVFVNNINQTASGKVPIYQYKRNFGSSYRVEAVTANDDYTFYGFRTVDADGSTTDALAKDAKTMCKGTLTGKSDDITYFGLVSGSDPNQYIGDTIYVMFEKIKPGNIVLYANNGTGQKAQCNMSGCFPLLEGTGFTVPARKTFAGWSTTPTYTEGEVLYQPGSDIGSFNGNVLYAVWRTGPSRAPAKKALTVRYHANFDPMEELALDLDPNPLLEDMDEDFGFEPDPLPEDVLDPTVDAVKTVTYKPDENVVLRHCMFKRAGYVFVGWNTEPDGTGKKYEVNGVPITDWAAGATVDLYAQWEKPHHLKPVDDSAPQLGGADATPTPQPGGADATPAPQPGGVDDAFGIDPHLGGMDDAFGVDPQPEGLDDAFGVDPADQPKALDDAFGVDPADQPKALDDAFGVDPDPQPEELDDAFGV